MAQNDSAWKNVQLGTSSNTIGSAGCCLTSFTMIRNFLSGTNDTPADVNSVLGSNACDFVYSAAGNSYGYTTTQLLHNNSGLSDDEAVERIIGAMERYNVPVLVGVKSSSGTHFVVAIGYNSANGIIIRDPAGRNYLLLNNYFDDGYYVHRIYCYTN